MQIGYTGDLSKDLKEATRGWSRSELFSHMLLSALRASLLALLIFHAAPLTVFFIYKLSNAATLEIQGPLVSSDGLSSRGVNGWVNELAQICE